MITTLELVAAVIVVSFVAGLLVGRKNPSIAAAAAKIAEDAAKAAVIAKAKIIP